MASREDISEFLLRLVLMRGSFSKEELMNAYSIEDRQARVHIEAFREAIGGKDALGFSRKSFRYTLRNAGSVGLQNSVQELYGDGERCLRGLFSQGSIAVPASGALIRGMGRSQPLKLPTNDAILALHASINKLTVYPKNGAWGWKGPLIARYVVDLGVFIAIRGFCLESQKWVFRPLVSPLNLKVVDSSSLTAVSEGPDTKWMNNIDIRIAPHKNIKNQSERALVAKQFLGLDVVEFESRGFEVCISVKEAVLPYFLHHWKVDAKTTDRISPHVYPLWLSNQRYLRHTKKIILSIDDAIALDNR